jgi:hypothetical protein
MPLPSSAPISLSQVEIELGLSAPFSMNHPWAIELSGKSVLPISLSDLLGKSGRIDINLSFSQTAQFTYSTRFAAPFFGINGQFFTLLAWNFNSNGSGTLTFPTPCSHVGNIKVTNNTTGVSVVMAMQDNMHWLVSPQTNANWVRLNQNDSYTILPSN